MEQPLIYKVRLHSGRILGPIGLSRIWQLIKKKEIQGNEQARSCPYGEWKPIHQFSEIAELLVHDIVRQEDSSVAFPLFNDPSFFEEPTEVNVLPPEEQSQPKVQMDSAVQLIQLFEE